jgi:hypothetical protein
MIDWVSFRWKTAGGSGAQEIAVLIAPGKEPAAIRRAASGAASGKDSDAGLFDVAAGPHRFHVTIRPEGAEAVKA